MASKIKVSMIGLGSIATYMHIPAFQAIDDIEVVSGCDTNERQAERVKRQFNIPEVYSDWKEMLAVTKPDAVVVCLPNSLHVSATKDALEAGCHVLCEKPLGMTSVGAKNVADIAVKYGKVLSVGYHNRYWPLFKKAKVMVENGEIGKILQIRGTFVTGGPHVSWDPKSLWYHEQSNGGVLFDSGSHLFDIIKYITGSTPSQAHVLSSSVAEDNALPTHYSIAWKSSDDVIGTAQLGWGGRTARQEVFIYGEAGHISVTPHEIEVRKPGQNRITDIFGHIESAARIASKIVKRKVRIDESSAYKSQAYAFVTAISGGNDKTASLEDAVSTLEILESIRNSTY